ncbi:MAG: hypothetical protein ABI775_01965 [Pseudonocardiales bacterium]|nr:hypothetical protein [Actinomycetota bacterium]
MSLISKALKIGVVAKLVQVVQREASKPENRKKIADAVDKVKSKRASGGSHVGQ